MITIREKGSGATLARGETNEQVLTYESNLYFAPESVERGVLRVTPRTYTCPFKGTCNWVDYVGPDGTTVADVAWVYPAPKPGHEAIKDRYGFYAGSRGPTRQD
jgi:uncharacterized protein (DUF427 family)